MLSSEVLERSGFWSAVFSFNRDTWLEEETEVWIYHDSYPNSKNSVLPLGREGSNHSACPTRAMESVTGMVESPNFWNRWDDRPRHVWSSCLLARQSSTAIAFVEYIRHTSPQHQHPHFCFHYLHSFNCSTFTASFLCLLPWSPVLIVYPPNPGRGSTLHPRMIQAQSRREVIQESENPIMYALALSRVPTMISNIKGKT